MGDSFASMLDDFMNARVHIQDMDASKLEKNIQRLANLEDIMLRMLELLRGLHEG